MDLSDIGSALRDVPSRISSMLGRAGAVARNWVDPSYDITPGLRPQDDEAMRTLISIIKGNSGMMSNAAALKQIGVDPRAIINTLLQAPGQTRVFTAPRRADLYGKTNAGTFTNTSDIQIYPKTLAEDQTTMLHEGIHAIQNQYGEKLPGHEIDESRAYYGTGESLRESFNQPKRASIDKLKDIAAYLQRRIGNQ